MTAESTCPHGLDCRCRMTDEPARDTTNDIAAMLAEALTFDDESHLYAIEAMQEGEWQWFQWWAREQTRPVAAAIADRLAAHTSHQQALEREVERVKWVVEVHLSRRGLWTSDVGLEIRAALATDPGQENT